MIEVTIHYPVGKRIDEPSGDRVRIEFVLPKRPFLFWADHKVGECLDYPWGYGVAYYDYERDRHLFAPIPFNIFVGAIIWWHHWLRVGFAAWCYRHKPKTKGKAKELPTNPVGAVEK